MGFFFSPSKVACLPLAVAVGMMTQCQKQKEETPTQKDHSKISGKELAQIHCSRCHLEPEPSQLTAEHWPFVLEWMGNYLGVSSDNQRITPLLTANLVPGDRLIGDQDWKTLQSYFLQSSGTESLLETAYSQLTEPSSLFETGEKFGSIRDHEVISAIHSQTESETRVIIANGSTNEVIYLDAEGSYLSMRGPFESQITQFSEFQDGLLAVEVGHLFKRGNYGKIRILKKSRRDNPILIPNLPRTPHARTLKPIASFPERLILACFGDEELGDLRIMSPGNDEPDFVFPKLGCVDARPIDLNADGHEDILGLFAHGHQEMWAFYNDGNGGYDHQKRLWQRPPGQGYVGFELADLNRDQLPDLLLISGNNVEIPNPPSREHHGVEIYENQGNANFKRRAFIPLPGATGVTLADFDLDQKIDFVAVSSFVDWRHPNPAGAILCRQQSDFQFTRERLPLPAQAPYFVAHACDIDQDGDSDLLISGFPFLAENLPPDEKRRAKVVRFQPPSLSILRNQTK